MSNPFSSNKDLLRRYLPLAAAGLLLLAVFPFSGQAGFFSWTDENGKTHFTDDVSKIPRQYRGKNDGLKKHKGLVDPSGHDRSDADAAPLPGFSKKIPTYEVPLIPIPGGNYLVKTLLNGKIEANLVVDTGASIVTLSAELGEALGWKQKYNTPEIPFSTAGGMVWMPLMVLNSVDVQGARVVEVEASINDDMGEIDGLLGMSFLGDFKLEVDRVRSVMRLKPFHEPGEAAWGGKPGSWWKDRFVNYNTQIDELEKQAGLLELSLHPKAHKFWGVVDFYKDLRRKLRRRAIRAGVPSRFRPQS